MVDLGALAFPLLLGAIYGVFRVGRHERSRVFEWARLVALAAMLGFLVTIEVRLIELGAIRSPVTLAAASVCVAGVFCLAGLHLYERREAARASAA